MTSIGETGLASIRRGSALTVAAIATFLSLAAIPPAGHAATPAEVTSIVAEGTQFRLTLADGRVMRSPELAGAKLVIATLNGPAKIQITAVERDPDAKSGDVWLHTLLMEQADGTTANLCQPGPDGRQQGFPTASHIRPDGGIEATSPEQFELVCTSGARGKCVRFGYRPWETAERDIYDACTRMVRADYRGDGAATTRNGMSIDLYDDRHIQTAENAPEQDFEAGWTANGAVCVRHVRVKENISLEELARTTPRFAAEVGGGCTEAHARLLGAVLFNRSKP
jgi:hypothetical protein